MNFETLFSVAGIVAMLGWLSLFASSRIPEWSDRIAGTILPVVLSLGYVMLVILPAAAGGGGFGSLAEVMELFFYEQAALAAWIHFLAFDLFIGAWACRTARDDGLRFLLVAPCLPLIFFFGPIGLLAFQTIRAVNSKVAVS